MDLMKFGKNIYPKKINEFIIRQKDITPSDRLLLFFIIEQITDFPQYRKSGSRPLSIRYISQKTNFYISNIQKSLKRLEKKNYIKIFTSTGDKPNIISIKTTLIPKYCKYVKQVLVKS